MYVNSKNTYPQGGETLANFTQLLIYEKGNYLQSAVANDGQINFMHADANNNNDDDNITDTAVITI